MELSLYLSGVLSGIFVTVTLSRALRPPPSRTRRRRPAAISGTHAPRALPPPTSGSEP